MQDNQARERFIVRERKLRESPRTLESLGNELGLSKERVRQLEAAAFGKMRKSLEIKEQGGAISKIEEIEILDGEIYEQPVADSSVDSPEQVLNWIGKF